MNLLKSQEEAISRLKNQHFELLQSKNEFKQVAEYYKQHHNNKHTSISNQESFENYESNYLSIMGQKDPMSINLVSLILEDEHNSNLMLNQEPEGRRSQKSEIGMAPKYCERETNYSEKIQKLTGEGKIKSAQGEFMYSKKYTNETQINEDLPTLYDSGYIANLVSSENVDSLISISKPRQASIFNQTMQQKALNSIIRMNDFN